MKKNLTVLSLFLLVLIFGCNVDSGKPDITGNKISLESLNNPGEANYDWFESVTESGDYYFAVGGSNSDFSSYSSIGAGPASGDGDFVIAKFAKSDLSLVCLKNPGGSGEDWFTSVIESDDCIIAAGCTWSDLTPLGGNDCVNGYASDFVIAKFDKSDLSVVSLNNFGGSSKDYFFSVTESEEYFIAAGYTQSDLSSVSSAGGSPAAGGGDFVIAMFDKSDLSLVRLNNFGGTDADRIESVIDCGDCLIAVGNSYSDLSSFSGGKTADGFDFVIARIDKSDLSVLGLNNFGGAGIDSFYSVIESGEHYIAAGSSDSDLSAFPGGSSAAGNKDFVIARFNKTDLSLVSLNNPGGTGGDVLGQIIESEDYYFAAGSSGSDLSSFYGGTLCSGGTDFVLARFKKSDLSLECLSNPGGTGLDGFEQIIKSGEYYIAAGMSQSNLASFSGGSANKGDDDFVLARFDK